MVEVLKSVGILADGYKCYVSKGRYGNFACNSKSSILAENICYIGARMLPSTLQFNPQAAKDLY